MFIFCKLLNYTNKTVILVLFTFIFALQARGQCAMCRATIENNANNGDIAFALNLNKGIIYLFIMPYILVGILALCWFWQIRIKKTSYND